MYVVVWRKGVRALAGGTHPIIPGDVCSPPAPCLGTPPLQYECLSHEVQLLCVNLNIVINSRPRKREKAFSREAA